MADSRRRILDMIAKGTVSAGDGMRLMEAFKDKKTSSLGTKLCVLVHNKSQEQASLSLRVPLTIVRLLDKFLPTDFSFDAKIANVSIDISSLDWKEIFSLAAAGEKGDLIHLEIQENDGSLSVFRIYIE